MTNHRPDDLIDCARALFIAAGLMESHARHLADAIVAADLFGFSSHGLALLPRYLDELADGRMAKTGTPQVVRDTGSSLVIDGGLLPGAAVVNAALDLMSDRLDAHGAATSVIRRSQHVGSLSAYLEKATSRGRVILIMSSNPHARVVAPFGGTKPAYSPNPIAFGIPTERDPILIDTSMASIAYNRCREYLERREELPGFYLFDSNGLATKDPNALFSSPPGAIRPFGGEELGYKGFALGLIVEALTSGLAGFGRSDAPAYASNSVFILLADPAAFGGEAFMRREMTALAQSCRAATSSPNDSVRMPGERALARRRQQLRDGIHVPASVAAALAERAAGMGVPSIFGRG